MGLYAKRPFAIAPYMGENAFIAYTVVKGMGLPWQTARGAIFIAGALFSVLRLLKVRSWMVRINLVDTRWRQA
jgi:AGZA family xanthine/uracil permease-like MFS transporter